MQLMINNRKVENPLAAIADHALVCVTCAVYYHYWLVFWAFI